jgi:hypothetical protein
LGRVDESGKIYRHVPGGPDLNVGRVEDNGKIYARQPGISRDELIGRVEGEPLIRAAGAAFFLLLDGGESNS